MIDPNDFIVHYQNHEKALKEANAFNKAAVFEALSVAGISTVIVEFDGEGDSGQIESVTASAGDTHVVPPATELRLKRASWQSESLTEVNTPLPEAIETLCYGYLEQYQGGWENNDGAFGSFTFDVAGRTIELEFNGRFTDVATHNYDL
jgi:hypothetical protein